MVFVFVPSLGVLLTPGAEGFVFCSLPAPQRTEEPRGSSWLLKNYPPRYLCLLILQRMLEESPSGHQGGGTCSRPAGLTRVPSNRETQASKPSTCPLTFWYMLSHTCCHETASPPKGSEPGPLHPAGISRLIEHPLLWQPCLGKGELEQFPSVPHRQKGRPLLT